MLEENVWTQLYGCTSMQPCVRLTGRRLSFVGVAIIYSLIFVLAKCVSFVSLKWRRCVASVCIAGRCCNVNHPRSFISVELQYFLPSAALIDGEKTYIDLVFVFYVRHQQKLEDSDS